MAVTKDDIRAEHDAALTSFDPRQLAALKRISRSFRESRFNNCSATDMMEQVFEEEADERNRDEADRNPPE